MPFPGRSAAAVVDQVPRPQPSMTVASAVGVGDGSSIDTGAGNDVINVGAHARGDTTHAWAMRRSQIDSGIGNDRVTLTATTGAATFDPAYVMTDSTLNLDSGNDVVQLKAHASGTASTSVIGAYGVLNSTIDTGTDNDNITLLASAYNRSGDAEAIGLGQASSVITGTGNDVFSIKANAKGQSTNAWAMRSSTLNTGSGRDVVTLTSRTTSGALDPAYGMEDAQLRWNPETTSSASALRQWGTPPHRGCFRCQNLRDQQRSGSRSAPDQSQCHQPQRTRPRCRTRRRFPDRNG